MTKILIMYGTTEGQTAKIARRIGDVLASEGMVVDVVDARDQPPHLDLTSYDAAMIGASMHIGGYQRAVHDFARRYAAQLERMPTAFFSVSLTEAYPEPAERARLDSYFTGFFERTGWHPQTVASFAGALAYSRYGFLKRLVMQSIARRVGAPTDPSRDIEYTDWNAVTRFAHGIAASVAVPPQPDAPLMSACDTGRPSLE